MSRRSSGQVGYRRSVTVQLDEDAAHVLDQTAIDFGLESRAGAALMMIRAWGSAMPMDTTVYEVTRQAVREVRRHEFEALAKFYDERAKMYGGSG